MEPSPPNEPAERLEAALRLAQALASRICHDLVSPVGAVANGADLLGELGGASGPEEIAMIGRSAARASDLLAFERLAFGAASADAPPIARAALARTLAGALATPRIRLTLAPETGPDLPRPFAKTLALASLAARGAIGLAGEIALRLDEVGGAEIALEGADPERAGPALARLEASPAELCDALGREIEPRTVETLLCPLAARAAGVELRIFAEPAAPPPRICLAPA